MWIFLITEIMFFGGMFAVYTVYRDWYPQVFAIASSSLNEIIGAANTAVLLLSQFHHGAGRARRPTRAAEERSSWFLILTLLFGGVFLGVKAYEWNEKFEEHHIPGQAAFHLEGVAPADRDTPSCSSRIYFAMTGLHALHMVIGVGMLLYPDHAGPQGQVLRRVLHARGYRPGSTGTSSTSSGSSCSRCST